MAVTLDDLGQHVLGKVGGKLTARERADLDSLLAWSVALVDRYLLGSTCPDAVRDAAVLRLCYFDYHVRLTRKPGDGGMLERPPRGVSLSPLKASGAAALLSPWKRRRAS